MQNSYRYYIINPGFDTTVCTNNPNVADQYAGSDEYYVIDTQRNVLLSQGKITPIQVED